MEEYVFVVHKNYLSVAGTCILTASFVPKILQHCQVTLKVEGGWCVAPPSAEKLS